VVAQPAGHFQMSSYPLTLLVGPAPDVLIFSAGFDRRYFDDATARRILSTLCTLLTGIAENPRRCLGELPVMTPGELHQLLVTWNRTAADTPWQTPVHRLFEAQAQRTADAPAVVLEDEVLTYGELNRCANRLAHRLRTLGVGPEARVALFLRRSPEMVIAVFAVLKAGGAYVPLEPETPRERLEFLVDDARAHFLLAQERLIPRLPRRRKVRTLGLEAEMAQSAKASCTDLRRGAGPRNLAYLIYTSGSTGRPKAVMIEHRSLADYSALAAEGAALAAGDRVLQFASLSFDASAEEIFPCLIRGATLVLRTDAMLETTEFTATCRKWRITVLDLPTAYWHELAAAPAAVASELPASVRLVILGGERVRPQAVAAWYERVGQAALLVNTYGPTEATVVAAMSPLSSPPAEWESAAGKAFDEVPIGRPRGNTRAYVTDRALRPVAVRVAGELLLGGLGLARGYHGRPGMTAEKFLPDSFGDGAGERLYRTGDLVRHRDDALADRREAASQLEFLGRVDHQVKIRGFRIELGDVEAALASHPMVSEAVVTARGEAPARLVAYFVRTAAAGAPPSSDQDLRGFLLDKLPEYMVPARFVELETLPVSASGKVDRGALPHPEGQRSRPEQTHAAPRNEMESRLVAIWEDVFAIAPVGIDDDFFALGGNSLLALRLMSRIRADLGCQLPLAVLFERGTVRQLAGVLRGDGEGQAWTPLVAIHKEGSRPPFFCVHPAGGDVLCYHGLARLLGADQPFYGLKAAGLDGRHEPHTTIEEMAASYVSAIREFQESGPFLLGGWSFGGVVAFEMARQLERQGREVGGLALFDTAIPQQTERLDELGLLVVFAKNLGVRITESSPVTLTDFAGLPRGAQLDYVLERAKAAGSLPGETSDVALERLWRVYASFFHAVGRYRPQSYGGRMLLLRAGAKPQEREQARETNWRPYVEGGIDVEWVGGSHIELVFEPHVRVLARALGTWLSSRAFRDGEG
jgi:amino acid adenylation domain-containing protein